MVRVLGDSCTIRYYTNKIVLDGDSEVIHKEADRLVRQFAASSKAYLVDQDRENHVVLVAHD